MSRSIRVASAISALVLCAPCASSAASPKGSAVKASPAAGACTGADTAITNEAARVRSVRTTLCLVNRERAQRGIGRVRGSGPLRISARLHSANMVAGQFFSHTSSNGDSVRKRVARTGYIRKSKRTLVGETIAWGAGGYATPAQLVASFMSSRSHRNTLLDRRYRDLGIGIMRGAPMLNSSGPAATLTLDFGRR